MVLCRKHLGEEHVELHMLAGTLRKGVSVKGYVERGLINCSTIFDRHEELAAEMLRRGMNHQSILTADFPIPDRPGSIDIQKSIHDLAERCPACKTNLLKARLLPESNAPS